MSVAVLGDDGRSASFNTDGEEASSLDNSKYEDVECVLNALKVPDYVLDHVGQTRALDGMQEDSWGGYTARWNYHPDDGLDLTVFEKQ